MARRRLRPALVVILLVVEAAGAGILGAALSSGGATPKSTAYVDDAPCRACALRLTSVEVQPRPNGTLFVVHGDLPSSVAKLSSDIRVQADGLDAVLHPSAKGSFTLTKATFNGQPLESGDIDAGIQHGSLLLFVPNGVLTTPLQFALGTWDGTRYLSRLPSSGSLLWNGSSSPSHDAVSAIGTPGASPGAPLVTGMADSCKVIPSGRVPGVLAVGAIGSGTREDPRRDVVTNFVGLTYSTPLATGFEGQAAFSAAIVVDNPAAPVPTTGLAVDRLGQLQLWAIWNGTTLYKAIREWNGKVWVTKIDDAADPLTLDMGAAGVTFYWPGLRPGEEAGSLIAVDGGCMTLDISPDGRGSDALTGLTG